MRFERQFDPNIVTDTGTRSVSKEGGVGGQRLTLGYGITSGSFNLTPSLFYIPNRFSIGSGATLKNTWGAQLQPGYYIPLNSPKFRALLLYGTMGYASADASTHAPQSDILCTPEIRRDGLQIQGAGPVYYPSNCANPNVTPETARFSEGPTTHSRLNGLVLGVGTKLAFSERIYGVLDFTYILYGKPKSNDLHQEQQIDGGTQPYAQQLTGPDVNSTHYTGSWSRDYNSGGRIRQTFIFIGAGYRFY